MQCKTAQLTFLLPSHTVLNTRLLKFSQLLKNGKFHEPIQSTSSQKPFLLLFKLKFPLIVLILKLRLAVIASVHTPHAWHCNSHRALWAFFYFNLNPRPYMESSKILFMNIRSYVLFVWKLLICHHQHCYREFNVVFVPAEIAGTTHHCRLRLENAFQHSISIRNSVEVSNLVWILKQLDSKLLSFEAII